MARVSVEISPEDLAWVKDLAHQRNDRTDNPRAKKFGKNGYEANLMGLMGEIATCRFYGAPTDTMTGPVDEGVDLELQGFTLQIKASRYFRYPAKLLAKPNEHFKAHAFLLALVDLESPVVQLAGWALTSELLAGHYGRAWPGAPWDNYYLEEPDLRECRQPVSNEEPGRVGTVQAGEIPDAEMFVEHWLDAWKDFDVDAPETWKIPR